MDSPPRPSGAVGDRPRFTQDQPALPGLQARAPRRHAALGPAAELAELGAPDPRRRPTGGGRAADSRDPLAGRVRSQDPRPPVAEPWHGSEPAGSGGGSKRRLPAIDRRRRPPARPRP